MPIGDVWRVAANGLVSPVVGPDPIYRSVWVLVWHIRTTQGIGTPTLEASDAIDFATNKLLISKGDGLFGTGCILKAVESIRVSDGFNKKQEFELALWFDEVPCLPSQCAVLLTGRSDALGRRTTKYAPGIANTALGDFGQLKLTGPVVNLVRWFDQDGGGTFLFESVIFDEEEVLPTIAVTRARVSPGFRTQRRRVNKATGEQVTTYEPIT